MGASCNSYSDSSSSLGELGEESREGDSGLRLVRSSSTIQSFTIPQGRGIIYIMCEEIPYWLAAISLLMCQRIVFVQYVAMKEIFDLSA